MDGVWPVAAAGAFLLVSHFGVSSTPLRGLLVARLGAWPYRGLYSLVSFAAIVWLVAAYNAAPHVPVWSYAPWQNWVPLLVNPLAVLLLVCALAGPNPTAMGQERALDREDPARGIQRITRNPFLWGVALWALAHMVPNGDAASLLFFGTFAILAGAGSALLDARLERSGGAAWDRFAAVTSNVPFVAILRGRQHFAPAEIGLVRTAAAAVLYVGAVHGHAGLFGVAAIPR